MANGDRKLKITHLLIVVILTIIAGAIAWGKLFNQQANHSETIVELKAEDDKKVSSEVFKTYIKNSDRRFEEVQESIRAVQVQVREDYKRFEGRLDKALAK